MAVELQRRGRRHEAPERGLAPARRGRPARRHRRLIRVAVTVAVIALAAALGTLLAATPSPAGAPARVAAGLSAHSAPSLDGQVPAKVATAVLATEDSRFRSDWAVDPRGALRAVWGLVTRNPDYGGATIEVQLAKLLYTPKRSDPLALAEQVAIASKMDHDFSKTEILSMYLDAAYFGDGAYGVTAAAQHYFGVEPGQLTWGQAALLAGLVQAPSRYDPHGHLTAALNRRRHVLARLVAVGAVTSAQAKVIASEPLHPAVPFFG